MILKKSGLRLCLPLLLALTMPALAQDQNDPDKNNSAGPARHASFVATGTVQKILQADMILLDDNKRYKLDNIRVPAEYSQQAMDLLNNTLLNKTINLYTTREKTAGTDRYGVPLVQVVRADSGAWIQADLISQGTAWAFSSESSRPMARPLQRYETAARNSRQGFWSNPSYAIKTSANVQDHINGFQIVEGKILGVKTKNKTTYLNFAQDWKKDFTIELSKKAAQLFRADRRQTFDPALWTGKVVRIRGWVDSKNGPMVELTHPEQMEILKE